MARKKRTVSETGRYHELLRGMYRLFREEQEFEEFTAILQKYSIEGNFRVLAYVLLENRIHLIVDTLGTDIGITLKPVCTSYARCYNRMHGGSGKLFYDRFKSEPLDLPEALKNAVAFVNFIAMQCDVNYPHCSMQSDICDFAGAGLTEDDFRNCRVTEMFIEDYDRLSTKELGQYVYELCGIMPKDFKTLATVRQREFFEKLTQKRWVSKSKLYEILGVGRRIHIKSEPQDEKPPETKKDLSVWLL